MAVIFGAGRLPGTSMTDGDVGWGHQAGTVEMALLDTRGVIVAVNDAWRAFTLNNGGDPCRTGVGLSYLDACSHTDDVPTRHVATAICEAIAGGLPAPVMITIPCDAPDQPRTFDVFVSSRLADDGACLGATVTLAQRESSEVGADPAWEAADDRPAGAEHRVVDILGICSSIVSDLSQHSVLANTVEAARTLTQARYAAIGLTDARGRVVDFAHTDPDGVVPDQSWGLSHAQVMLAMVSEGSRPLRLRQLADHPGAGGTGMCPPKLDSLLAVGLQRGGHINGVLYLANSHWGEFDAEDEGAMCALAEFAGQLLEEAQRRADQDHRQQQDRSREMTATELKQRVVEIFDETRRAAGLSGNVYFAGVAERLVPPALAADVEHVVRQGLSNMAEHTDVGVIVVGLSLTETLLTIDLIDDGRGDEQAHPVSLAMMRRLANSYGGSLDFSNGASRGTFLRWSALLDAPTSAD